MRGLMASGRTTVHSFVIGAGGRLAQPDLPERDQEWAHYGVK